MKYLGEKCCQCSDKWGDGFIQLAGVQYDIVNADGKHHKDWKTKFHLRTKDDDETLKEIDHGFHNIAKEVGRDRKKIWTSAELDKLYLDDDNVIYDRRTFIHKLLNYFNGDLIPFTNRGYLSWIVF